MIIEMIEDLMRLNKLKNDVRDLSIVQIKDFFNRKLYFILYEFAKSKDLEEYIELLNFLDSVEYNVCNLKIKRKGFTEENFKYFIEKGYIDKINSNLDSLNQIRINIIENFLIEIGYVEIESITQILNIYQEGNYFEKFKDSYYLTNEGLNYIYELYLYYRNIIVILSKLELRLIIDRLLDDKNNLNLYEYKYKHYIIKSNKPFSKELFEIIIDNTSLQLEDDKKNYVEVIFKVTNKYTKLNTKYINYINEELNSFDEIDLKIEKISDELVVNDIKNILFIRWLTFRHRSINEKLTSWLKSYGFASIEEAINENVQNGYLIEAPLRIQIDTLLNVEDLKEVLRDNNVKNYSKLKKEELVNLYLKNSENLNSKAILQNKRVYILSLLGIQKCRSLIKNLPNSVKWYYDYSVFFKEIEWNYKNEVNKFKKYQIEKQL